MQLARAALLFTTALVVTACAGEDAPEDIATTRVDPAQADRIIMDLAAWENSGITGNATLTPQDGAVVMALHIMGAEGDFVGHVHRGACADLATPSAPVASLGTINVGTGGMANASATVNMPLDSIADGRHVMAFRRGAEGPVVACSEIPRSN